MFFMFKLFDTLFMCKICFLCVTYVFSLWDMFFISEIWFSYLNCKIYISYKFHIYLSWFQIRLVWVYLPAFLKKNKENVNCHSLPQLISVTTLCINKHMTKVFLNLFITDWRLSIMADENFNNLNDLLSNVSPLTSSLMEMLNIYLSMWRK